MASAMPLYLVRWAGLHASLVSARDERDLLDVLDQVDDPGGCTYHVYRGPVWVDFELPFEVRDITPEKTVATDVNDYTVEPTSDYHGTMSIEDLRVELPDCDWSQAMQANVICAAFPHLHQWMEEHDDIEVDEDADEAANDAPGGDGAQGPEVHYPASLRAALVADLEPLIRYSQAVAERDARDDHEAEVMKAMNVTKVPPSWTAEEDDPEEQHRQNIADAVARLADALAEKLGVSTEAVVAALVTPEAGECLEDLYGAITGPAEDFQEPGLHDLRVSAARARLRGDADA